MSARAQLGAPVSARARASWVLAAGLLVSTAARAADPPGGEQQACVDVAVGSAQSYACLNQELGAMAARQPRPSSANSAPVSAFSPGNVTGQFNESATRNRLGSSFGRSVTPERPAYAPPSVSGPRS